MNIIKKIKLNISPPLIEPPKEVTRAYSQYRINLAHKLRFGKITQSIYDERVHKFNLEMKRVCRENKWRDITF